MGGAQWGLEPRELTRVLRFGQDLSPTRCWLLSFCSVQVAGRAGTGRGHKWGHKNTSPCGHTVTLLVVTPILGERGRGLPGPEALGCVTCCWPPTWRFSSSGTCTRFPKGKAACRSTPQFPRELFPGFLFFFFFFEPLAQLCSCCSGVQSKGNPGRACWMGSPLPTPCRARGKSSSCSAHAVAPGQEPSHAESHRADPAGC